MKHIELIDDLSLKKLDIEDTKDLWLIQELDKEKNEFFFNIENLFYNSWYRTRAYLKNGNFYNAPLGIYYEKVPIGYLEIALLEKLNSVDISYELLQSKRKNGYATTTLKEVTRKILMDKIRNIKRVQLLIDIENKSSQKVALNAGFQAENLSQEGLEEQGFITYEKTDNMLKLERNRKIDII